jgi:hypothetical protein
MRFLAIGAILLGALGCAKAQENQMKSSGGQVPAEWAELVNEINSAGTPDWSWSDAELRAHEAKLNRVQGLDNEIFAANGQEAAGWDRAGSQAKDAESAADQSRFAEIRRLIEENASIAQGLVAKGDPTPDWPDAKLDEFVRTFRKTIENDDVICALLQQLPNTAEKAAFQQKIEAIRAFSARILAKTKRIKDEKARAKRLHQA